MIVVWIVARRLTEPVRRLTLAAEHVSQQRYETADDLDRVAGRRDEFGQLARTFRNMVGEIANRETTLRNAEEKLRQSELHYRSLIENTSDIIALIDKEGRFKYASPSIVRILGVRNETEAGALGDFLDDKGKAGVGQKPSSVRRRRGARPNRWKWTRATPAERSGRWKFRCTTCWTVRR